MVPSFGPQLGALPSLGPRVAYPQAQGSLMGMAAPLLGMGLMGFSQEAGGPEMPLPNVSQAGLSPPEYQRQDVMPDNLTFGSAFRKARQLGLQEFTWRGKRYTTELK